MKKDCLNGFTQESLDAMLDEPVPVEMSRKEAAMLLREALDRIENPGKNYCGGEWQSGGAYWRLMKVLRDYVLPCLVCEKERMFEIIRIHGLPVDFDLLPAREKERIEAALYLIGLKKQGQQK